MSENNQKSCELLFENIHENAAEKEKLEDETMVVKDLVM